MLDVKQGQTQQTGLSHPPVMEASSKAASKLIFLHFLLLEQTGTRDCTEKRPLSFAVPSFYIFTPLEGGP